MALGKTAQFYRDNPKAKAVKAAYDKKFQKKREQVKKRVECNKFNRKNKKYGNGDQMDCSHKNGTLVYEHRRKKQSQRRRKESLILIFTYDNYYFYFNRINCTFSGG